MFCWLENASGSESGGEFAGVLQDNNQIELVEKPWLDLRRRSLAGSVGFPNIVYFPSECRTRCRTVASREVRGRIIEPTRFNWVAEFDSNVNLDSVMLTLKALSEEQFAECLKLVNLALEHRHKRITGFGPKGKLIVSGNTDAGVAFQHHIEDLSSGEQEILLLVGFVVAFLRPGGIVLLDESDLHIHISMIAQLLETLEHIVRKRNGQLIAASHSLRVLEWFAREDERFELSPWRHENG